MKAIMMSIKPRHDKNILNGIKTLEIRKKFPVDYVGWVYIYNTKTTKDGVLKLAYIGNKLEFVLSYDKTSKYQGKVVGRFWCDKVDEFYDFDDDLCEQACLDRGEMLAYLGDKKGYAISITKLEIFDKPKELSEFYKCEYIEATTIRDSERVFKPYLPLTRAPQSWCYVEV